MSKQINLATLIVVLFVVILVGFATASTLTIRPNGQGYYANWTNVGYNSSSEWLCVNENSVNNSDYLVIWSGNVLESFLFEDTGLTNETINNITFYFYAKSYNLTQYQFQSLIRVNSTKNILGSVKNLTSNYNYYAQVYSTNPATGNPWTVSEINELESGMKSTQSVNGGGIVSQTYTVVDYN